MSSVAASLGAIQRRAPVLQLGAMGALFLYGAATISGFASSSSVKGMLVLAALLGLAAAGQTLVVILGGLDLSVPGFILGGAVGISQLTGAEHWPVVPALAVIVAIAAVMGGTSGWLCHRYRLESLIVTLGMGAVATGAVLVWTKGLLTGAPPAFVANLSSPIATTFGLGIPPVVAIWATLAVVLAFVLHRTVVGRHIYATGANPRAAGLVLVRTGRIWTTVFAASAVLSALVGVLLAGFAGADQGVGDPYLFQGLAAVIVGGTAITGSRGDYTHTVVGALILTLLSTILVGHGYDTSDQQVIFGVLILLVVAGYGRDRKLRDRI